MAIISVEDRVGLLRRLTAATEAGKLFWSFGSRQTWLRSETGTYTYTVNSVDDDDQAPYEFRIFRELGDADEAADVIAHWTWSGDDWSEVDEAMATLYQTARPLAGGIDENETRELLAELARLDGGSTTQV